MWNIIKTYKWVLTDDGEKIPVKTYHFYSSDMERLAKVRNEFNELQGRGFLLVVNADDEIEEEWGEPTNREVDALMERLTVNYGDDLQGLDEFELYY